MLKSISDKKIGNDSSGVVNYYIAEVLSQNDYYPEGIVIKTVESLIQTALSKNND